MLFYPSNSRLSLDTVTLDNNFVSKDDIIDSSESCKIHYILLEEKQRRGPLFFFAHGNGGDISSRVLHSPTIKYLMKHGSVLLFDYRGYGNSTGTPTEQGLRDDTLAMWNYTINTLNWNPNNVVLFGESLGCSLVSYLGSHLILANKEMPRGIIMMSGFYSLKKTVSTMFGYLISLLLVYEFDNNKYLGLIKEKNPDYPVLILHSKKDDLLSFDHAVTLAQENNCRIHEIGGVHCDPIFTDKTIQLIYTMFTLSTN